MEKSQTALEYVFFAGGALLFVAVVIIVSRSNIIGVTGGAVEYKSTDIQEKISDLNCQLPEVFGMTHSFTDNYAYIHLSWYTDVPSTSTVFFYGDNPKIGGQNYFGSSTPVTHHTITVKLSDIGVAAICCIYHVRINSCIPGCGCDEHVQDVGELVPVGSA